jgi:uracil-DNA glycosylase family 4
MDNPCQKCPYHESGRLHVAPSNRPYSSLEKENNGSDILLIFQSPGDVEWEAGLPLQNFKNGAGLRLENSYRRIGKSRSDFDITNAVQCYQGKGANGRDKKPCKIAQEKCRKKLKIDIESKSYRKIIVFGAIARHQVEALGYSFENDQKFKRLTHPSGGLTNIDLDGNLSA